MRIRGLIRALNDAGVENRLCTYHHGHDVEGVEALRSLTIPWYTKLDAGPSNWKYLADVFLFFRTWATALAWKPDVIHGHLHEGALIGWAVRCACFWRRIPLVFDMQGSLVGELSSHEYVKNTGLKQRVFRRLERFIDHLPRRIFCSSEHSRTLARTEFDVPESRLIMVEDGADVVTAAPSEVADLRAELQLPADELIVVYSGSLLRVKGLDSLHALLREVHERGMAVHFLLVGYPVEETREFVATHGLQDACTLTGMVPYDRLARYLGVASVALDPKDSGSGEASGKLLNYMAAGLPVVCFDTPHNRAILGDAGCYAASGSVGELADRIGSLAADGELRRSIGARLRERVDSRFTWKAAAARVHETYVELTGDRS